MKIKESQLRTIIRNVLQESLFNDKIQHTSLDKVMCRCYILTPETTNVGTFFATPAIKGRYTNAKEFVKVTFDKIKTLFDEELKQDYTFVYVGEEGDDRIIVFDEIDPQAFSENESVGANEIKNEIKHYIPECWSYYLGNTQYGGFTYPNGTLKIATQLDIDENPNIKQEAAHFATIKGLMSRRYIFKVQGPKQMVNLVQSIKELVPPEYVESFIEDLEIEFAEHQQGVSDAERTRIEADDYNKKHAPKDQMGNVVNQKRIKGQDLQTVSIRGIGGGARRADY